jgi:hypothetical protein
MVIWDERDELHTRHDKVFWRKVEGKTDLLRKTKKGVDFLLIGMEAIKREDGPSDP